MPVRHPDVYIQFQRGEFVIQKGNRKFSCMGIDHAHEQNNKVVKGAGGVKGILDKPDALLKWMIAGPKMGMMVKEYEVLMGKHEDNSEARHHEDTRAFEKRFTKHVKSFVQTLENEGSPFSEEEDILVTLISKVIMNEDVVQSMKGAREIGMAQYKNFTEDRINTGKTSIHETIKKNKLCLFRGKHTVVTPKEKLKLTAMKQDCKLFASLYLICQSRECDLKSFSMHENHAYPPSISSYGQLRQTSKSDTLKILGSIIKPEAIRPSHVSCVLLDGAAIVHMVAPKKSKTFVEYAENEFAAYLKSFFKEDNIKRIDLIFDVYKENSIKEGARQKRGQGMRLKVADSTLIPKSWKNFLKDSANKEELFKFLAKSAVRCISTDRVIVVTFMDQVLTNGSAVLKSQLSPCNHEEADTRLLLHASNCALHDHNKVLIKTVDTDVVIIALSQFSYLNIEELWIELGSGKDMKWYPIHEIASVVGQDICSGVLFWYAMSGCDTVSAFAGRGKVVAWKTWQFFPEVTSVFERLSHNPEKITEEDFATLERFTVLLYDRSSTITDVNESRQWLFTKKSRSIEMVPPTKDALFLHMLRAAYQAG